MTYDSLEMVSLQFLGQDDSLITSEDSLDESLQTRQIHNGILRRGDRQSVNDI